MTEELPGKIKVEFWLNENGSPKTIKESSIEFKAKESCLFFSDADLIEFRGGIYHKPTTVLSPKSYARLDKEGNPYKVLVYSKAGIFRLPKEE